MQPPRSHYHSVLRNYIKTFTLFRSSDMIARSVSLVAVYAILFGGRKVDISNSGTAVVVPCLEGITYIHKRLP
jgi:hypothetical protein